MTVTADFDRPLDQSFVRLFAHRGTRLLAPENTFAAFDLAVSLGADVLETDVRLSRDDVVMVTHDADVQRTTDGQGAVRQYSHLELDSLDAGSRFIDPQGKAAFRGCGLTLPSLDALFDRYPHVGINIDIKDDDPAAARAVAEVLRRHPAHPWCTVGSFHARVIRYFRQLAPSVPTAASRGEVARLYFGRALASPPCRSLQIPPRYGGLRLDTRAFISHARRRGIDVVYWTIDDPERMRELLERGASGIVTDRPDLAAPVFAAFRQGTAYR